MEEGQAESAQARIAAAQAATDAILEALGQAREALERAAFINGAGILASPAGTGSDVRPPPISSSGSRRSSPRPTGRRPRTTTLRQPERSPGSLFA